MINGIIKFAASQLKRNAPALTLLGLTTIKTRLTYQVSLKDSSMTYDSFHDWLYKHHGNKFRNVGVDYHNINDTNLTSYQPEQREESFVFLYKSHPIHVRKSIKEVEGNYDNREYASYILSTMFNKSIIHDLLKEVYISSYKKDTDEEFYLTIYTFRGHWKYYKEYLPIPINEIILSEGVKPQIVESIDRWKDDNLLLKELRRSTSLTHLYYGPPGSGKTSIITAIGYKYEMDVYYLNLAGITMIDELQQAFDGVRENSIILIEEIDQVYKGRKSINKNTVKFEAFIQFLSGVLVKSNVMIIMTTNDISDLDPALIRAGRVDLKIRLGEPTLSMVNEYLDKFYSTEVNLTDDIYLPKSMALLESWCIANLRDINGVFDKLKEEPCEEDLESLNIKTRSWTNSGKTSKKEKSKKKKSSKKSLNSSAENQFPVNTETLENFINKLK